MIISNKGFEWHTQGLSASRKMDALIDSLYMVNTNEAVEIGSPNEDNTVLPVYAPVNDKVSIRYFGLNQADEAIQFVESLNAPQKTEAPLHFVTIREQGKKPRVILRYDISNAITIAAQRIALTGERPRVTGGNVGAQGYLLNQALFLAYQIDPLSL